MFKWRSLSLILILNVFDLPGAFSYSEGGPGFLPPERAISEIKGGATVSTRASELATHKRVLKDWLACYQNFKTVQPKVMQYVALVKIADVQYQLGNIAEAERLYKEASDATEADLLSVGDKAISQHSVAVCALNSYACFLAEKGQIDKAARLMRLIYSLLKQPQSYSMNVGFGGSDDFGTFLTIVKNKDAKIFAEFYPQWKAHKTTVVQSVQPKVTGLKIEVENVEQLSDFVGNLALARDQLTCRYGYVNRAGKWAIKPTFIAATPFNEKVATAKFSSGTLPIEVEGNYDKYSLIDSSGDELVRLPAFYISNFVGAFCFAEHHARGPSYHIFDHTGDTLYSGHFRYESLTPTGLKIFEVTGESRRGCIVSEVGHTVMLDYKPDESRPGHYKLVKASEGPEKVSN